VIEEEAHLLPAARDFGVRGEEILLGLLACGDVFEGRDGELELPFRGVHRRRPHLQGNGALGLSDLHVLDVRGHATERADEGHFGERIGLVGRRAVGLVCLRELLVVTGIG